MGGKVVPCRWSVSGRQLGPHVAQQDMHAAH
jgi:hypothetical protein